jgi:signal transduction histidine kinase
MVETNLNQVIENVKNDLDLLIEERQVIITHNDIPPIMGISVQLHQLFFNLISNSIKFNINQPQIDICSSVADKKIIRKISQLDKNQAYLQIIFQDNGIGFKQQYAEQVFKLFQRLDSEHKGTGIGLALCKRIIENHKGHIDVDSQPDQGTVFTIYLPL